MGMSGTAKSYGKLVVTFDLTKDEARDLEETLAKKRRIQLAGTLRYREIHVEDIQVSEVDHNVQYLTVKGNA
jgi:hypothetical protein